MMSMEILEDKFKWPCKTCGADQAPEFYFDDITFEVIGCANCKPLQQGWHIADERCWCHPQVKLDPKTGEEGLVHVEKQ